MSKELNLPERVAKFQTDVLQTFLLEYCKINHVEECELSGHLSVLRLKTERYRLTARTVMPMNGCC